MLALATATQAEFEEEAEIMGLNKPLVLSGKIARRFGLEEVRSDRATERASEEGRARMAARAGREAGRQGREARGVSEKGRERGRRAI